MQWEYLCVGQQSAKEHDEAREPPPPVHYTQTHTPHPHGSLGTRCAECSSIVVVTIVLEATEVGVVEVEHGESREVVLLAAVANRVPAVHAHKLNLHTHRNMMHNDSRSTLSTNKSYYTS